MGEVKYRLYSNKNKKMIEDAPVIGYVPKQENDETTAAIPAQAMPMDIAQAQQLERPRGETPNSFHDQEIQRRRTASSQIVVSKEIPEELEEEN